MERRGGGENQGNGGKKGGEEKKEGGPRTNVGQTNVGQGHGTNFYKLAVYF